MDTYFRHSIFGTIMWRAIIFLFCLVGGEGVLWKKGVVHYTINKNDYDPHSQDLITGTFAKIEREICVKFFQSHPTSNTSSAGKRLVIANPNRVKDCQPNSYNYSADIVIMPIGYNCLNTQDMTRIIVDMLRASIENTAFDIFETNDMLAKYKERDHDPSTLLTPDDRNFINSHYFSECGSLSSRPLLPVLRSDSTAQLSSAAFNYYKDKLWPLGVVMYGVSEHLRGNPAHTNLKFAMTTIELVSCIMFQFYDGGDSVLAPKNVLWFSETGESTPAYGFTEGNQTINLKSVVYGAPGHTAHALNNLMRALGVGMMSNRYDRDNYVQVNWRNVDKGMEHLLEKQPEESWVPQVPYDFDSVTHAPANFACESCRMGQTSVQPIQDNLWQHTLAMGHRATLSKGDIEMLSMLYAKECQERQMA